jgi:hypothetical protein
MSKAVPGGGGTPHEIKHAVDQVLACDRHVHCSQRLQCTWIAAELAEQIRLNGR